MFVPTEGMKILQRTTRHIARLVVVGEHVVHVRVFEHHQSPNNGTNVVSIIAIWHSADFIREELTPPLFWILHHIVRRFHSNRRTSTT